MKLARARGASTTFSDRNGTTSEAFDVSELLVCPDPGTMNCMPSGGGGRVLSVFAALGSDPDRIASRGDACLSPGEARKLAIALGLGRNAWGVVLDEPTNHLDLPTIERLERALAAYPGAVVLVTHDDRFAEAVTTRTITP